MTQAVIIDAVRTPIGRRGGALKDVRPDDLAAHVLRAIVERTGIKPSIVEDVILGCNTQTDEQGINIARVAALVAGFPETVPGTTVTRMCGSGQQAVNFGAMEVLTGTSDLVIAGGVESMSRVPMGSDMGALNDKLLARFEVVPQGISADLIADKYGITREQMDEYSLWSHRKAIKAIDDGRFKDEIAPVPVMDETGNKKLFDTDEHPRRNTSLEKLASLPPAFKPDGRVTAGNSSGINDGAAALLIATPEKAKELGLEPRARIARMWEWYEYSSICCRVTLYLSATRSAEIPCGTISYFAMSRSLRTPASAPIGTRLIDSTPPAITRSYVPAITPCAPKFIAC